MWYWGGAAGCVFLAVASGLAIPIRVVQPAVIDLGEVPAFLHTKRSIPLKSQHWLRSAKVEFVSSSRGCVSVASERVTVGPRGSLDFSVTVHPVPWLPEFNERVILKLPDGTFAETAVTGRVAPPFAGWPDRVEASSIDGALVVRLAPLYRGVFSSVELVDADTGAVADGVTVAFDPARDEVRLSGLNSAFPARGLLRWKLAEPDGDRSEWAAWLVAAQPK